MSTVIMNMSQGSIERDEPVTVKYDSEMMCSGRNQTIAMTQLVTEDKYRAFPAEMVGVDLQAFLHKMHG